MVNFHTSLGLYHTNAMFLKSLGHGFAQIHGICPSETWHLRFKSMGNALEKHSFNTVHGQTLLKPEGFSSVSSRKRPHHRANEN
jgi:hypothetical protein